MILSVLVLISKRCQCDKNKQGKKVKVATRVTQKLFLDENGWLVVRFRQGPRFSIRMVIRIFCSDTDEVFVQLNQYSQN